MQHEIMKVLVLSTAHISPADLARMNEMTEHDQLPVFRWPYGWIIQAENDREHGQYKSELPSLHKALAYAEIAGCGWLRLDCDGECVPDLPVYDH